jgi:hypothetical protein
MDFINSVKQIEEPLRIVKAVKDYLAVNGQKISQNKTLSDVSFYHDLAIGETTRADFFQGTASSELTNVGNSFTRPEGEHVIITGLQILEGNNATLGATDWIPVTAGANWVKNGYFTIYVNGVKQSEKIPATDFLKSDGTVEPASKELMIPILWAGQTDLRIEYVSATAGAASDNLRVVVKGLGLV